MKYDSRGHIINGEKDIPPDLLNHDYKEIISKIKEEGLIIEPYIPPKESSKEEKREREYEAKLTRIARDYVIALADNKPPADIDAILAKLKDEKKKIDDAITASEAKP